MLPSWSFRVWLHFGLMCVACMALAWKEATERNSRTWFDFGLDTSKQVLAAGWVHVLDAVCVVHLAARMSDVDPCSRYGVSVVVDTTIGVVFQYYLLGAARDAIRSRSLNLLGDLLETGSYWTTGTTASGKHRFRPNRYVGQLGLWLAIVTVAKLALFVILWLMPIVATIFDLLLFALDGKPRAKFFVAVICIPMFTTTFQLLATDRFLRKQAPAHPEGMAYMQPTSVELLNDDDDDIASSNPPLGSCFLCGTQAPSPMTVRLSPEANAFQYRMVGVTPPMSVRTGVAHGYP